MYMYEQGYDKKCIYIYTHYVWIPMTGWMSIKHIGCFDRGTHGVFVLHGLHFSWETRLWRDRLYCCFWRINGEREHSQHIRIFMG